ncbi:MAG: hypothetical protein IPL93_01240 [Actinomycetales bacterium]|nr:hypothetical protein [Actinomycetales bacterium]
MPEFLGPFSLAMLVGLSTCQDLAYDGGLGIGLGSVALGTRLGGSHLDGHWPEVLKNVSEKHA